LAVDLTSGLKQKDRLGEIAAIHAFVRDCIRYVWDVRGVETLHDTQRILDQKAGDCDDKSILTAALLEAIGYPTRFVAVGIAKDLYQHVLVEVQHKGQWIPLETTEPVPMGWYPTKFPYRMLCTN
jgi:transglutaminase-like putative cysteine protease